jgi:predicted glycosyltransferase
MAGPGERPGLLFYCQHSMGIGHLMRSFALCEALSHRYRVQLVCGGRIPEGISPPGGFEILPLPAIRANLDFSLASQDEHRSVGQILQTRGRMILQIFHELKPSVVVIELFPFGRKKFGPELLPLLEAAAKARSLVVCSLRDLLVGRADQPTYDERASRVANAYFDAVLVHADPKLARLEETFRPGVPLRVPVFYTGYVTRTDEPASTPAPSGPGPALVSAGSGGMGAALLRAAVAAQPEVLATTGWPMRIIAGPHFPPEVWEDLEARVRGRIGVDLVRVVPALVPELRRASVSISQCGYNTALEILRTKVPALVVPAIEEGDQEIARALRLEKLRLVRVLTRDRLTPESLAAEIRELRHFRPAQFDLDTGGADASARLIEELEHGRARRPDGAPKARNSLIKYG